MVELKEPLTTLWRGKDAFGEVKTLQGEVFRELETRRTLRFELAERSYFRKWHRGTSLKEIVKNLLSFRMPVLGADREWNAIHRLSNLGVDTMHGVGFGEKGLTVLLRRWHPCPKCCGIIRCCSLLGRINRENLECWRKSMEFRLMSIFSLGGMMSQN